MDSQDLPVTSGAKSSRRGKAASPKQDPAVVKDFLSVSVSSKAFNIYAVKKGSSDVASFALTNTGASSTGGVTFVFPSTFKGSVTVTWVLGSGISSLTSETLQFSQVSNNTQTLTLTAPTTASSDAAGYAFTVVFTGGGTHDPQIIVSPIGGQPPSLGKSSKPLPVKKGKAAAKRAPAPKAPAKSKAKAPAKAKRGGGPARKNKR